MRRSRAVALDLAERPATSCLVRRLRTVARGYPERMEDNREATAEPVSWYAIEPGWKVITLDGVPVGSVDEVQSDEELDIFHGISVRVGIGRLPREVSSDLVSAIEEGTVTLGILSDEIGSLPNSS